jgi:C1A family cysteine protease
MKFLLVFSCLMASVWAKAAPSKFVDLLPYVQAAPDQGETNTCLFMASTGAMELLLNRKYGIKNPKPGSSFDLAESFLIWQGKYFHRSNPPGHFIEEAVQRFNHGEAILHRDWPFNAFNSDGTDNMGVWERHPQFWELPRIKVPRLKTELLFAKGKKWITYVLNETDIQRMKQTLAQKKAPLIVNYNDDRYWHVVLIVGYDDDAQGDCYEIEESECNNKGAFFVRDSNGQTFEKRAYNWFLIKGNAAASIEFID